MTTIYSAAGTFPLKIRESMSTRFSGLIEYSATFLVEKGANAAFAVGAVIGTTLGSVSIFPGVRYVRNNDSPFDEVELTAYGKGFALGTRVVFGTEILELSKTFEHIDATQTPPVTTTWTVYETWRCETATKHQVLDNTSSNYSDPSNSLDKDMIRRWIIGQVASSGRDSLNIDWNTGVRDVQRTNFGAWDEVAVMKGYVPEVS
jgi:hypothetical protein